MTSRGGAVAWLALLVVSLVVPPSRAETSVAVTMAASDSGVALPAWLTGSWVTQRGARMIEEQWNEPRAGMMQAVGRTTQGEKLVEFEFLRIVKRGGSLVYIAQPNGRPPTEFALTAHGADSLRFENPSHDFPQVVTYRRTGPDAVLAVVSATVDGKTRAVRFEYRRPSAATDSSR